MKLDVRAKDPIFEAIVQWRTKHPEVYVQIDYADEYIRITMLWDDPATRNVRAIPFTRFDSATLRAEDITRFELDEMYEEVMKARNNNG